MAALSNGVFSTAHAPTISEHAVNTQDENRLNYQDQTKLLSGWPLIRVFATLSTAQFVSFMDQVAIGMLIPSIGVDIQAEKDIAWLGTASLMGMTAFSPLWGRGSDLLGRKNCLLVLLVVLGLASLGCAVARDFGLMCTSRVFAGIANGGISSLVQTMVSDHVTLQQRSKYQGILGTMVGAGSVVGVLSSSLLDMHSSWRHQYYMQCGLVSGVFAVCWTHLPSYKPTMNFRKIFAEFDKEGFLAVIAAVVLILVATSQGGRPETPWNSPTIIALYTTGVLCFLTFLAIEWRWARLPIVPLRMLGNRSVAAMLGQTFLLGASYQINSYYLQLYLQNVHNYTPFKGALLQMSLPIVQSIAAPAAGLLQSKTDSYIYIHLFGFCTWTIGSGLLIACNEHTHPALFCFIIMLVGIGTGCVLQPTLVALQAHCSKGDRAVVISSRNFLRKCGGASGLAVASAVATRTFTAKLPSNLRNATGSTFAAPNLEHLHGSERPFVRDSCQAAIRMVFILSFSFIALCPVLCAAVKDNGLTRAEEKGVDDGDNGASTDMIEKGTPTSDSVLANSTPEISRNPSLATLKSVWSILMPDTWLNRRPSRTLISERGQKLEGTFVA